MPRWPGAISSASGGTPSSSGVPDQADSYLVDLEEGIVALADNPGMGISRELVRPGYRVLLINHHAVYYKVMAAMTCCEAALGALKGASSQKSISRD